MIFFIFFFKQKTAYEMRISDWSSDVCSSDLRPSTYASTLQTLKDRDYVRIEKNRFFAEESGRLVTAFLERFFERYVSYDFTAGLEDELDEVSGGRAAWQKVLEAFWRDFKPKTAEVMRSEERRVGKEWVSTGRSWGSPMY